MQTDPHFASGADRHYCIPSLINTFCRLPSSLSPACRADLSVRRGDQSNVILAFPEWRWQIETVGRAGSIERSLLAACHVGHVGVAGDYKSSRITQRERQRAEEQRLSAEEGDGIRSCSCYVVPRGGGGGGGRLGVSNQPAPNSRRASLI